MTLIVNCCLGSRNLSKSVSFPNRVSAQRANFPVEFHAQRRVGSPIATVSAPMWSCALCTEISSLSRYWSAFEGAQLIYDKGLEMGGDGGQQVWSIQQEQGACGCGETEAILPFSHSQGAHNHTLSLLQQSPLFCFHLNVLCDVGLHWVCGNWFLNQQTILEFQQRVQFWAYCIRDLLMESVRHFELGVQYFPNELHWWWRKQDDEGEIWSSKELCSLWASNSMLILFGEFMVELLVSPKRWICSQIDKIKEIRGNSPLYF